MVIRIEEFTIITSPDPPYIAAEQRELIGEFKPIQWSIHRGQDETGSWSFTIPFFSKFADIFIDPTRSLTAYLLHDGIEQMHGLINDVKLTVSGDKLVYAVSGLGETGVLARYVSKSFAHYEDTPLLAIFYDLLSWAGWALGDHQTMPNITEVTTIDLRDQKNVLAQIRRVVDSIPNLHWRYGGVNAGGRETMDFGYFDTVSPIRLQQGDAVIVSPTMDSTVGQIRSIKFADSREQLISEVIGNGGTYALDTSPDRQRVLDMWAVNEAFTADPTLEDANYPLVQDGDGFYRVRNLALHPTGGSSRETWDYIVTKNAEAATVAERNNAAYALYLKCIRFLEENSTINRTYTIDVRGLKNMPLPGNRVRVDANYITVYDVPVPGFELHEDLRVGAWDLKGSKDKVTASFTLSATEFMGQGVDPLGRDDVIQLTAGLGEQPYNRIGGALTENFGNPVQNSYVGNVAFGSPPDCITSDSTQIGILLTIPLAVIPPPEDPLVPITEVKVIGFLPQKRQAAAPLPDTTVPTENFTIDIVQQPTIGGTPLIVCFNWDRDWDAVIDSLYLSAYMRFY
jgi:hypothetical protein